MTFNEQWYKSENVKLKLILLLLWDNPDLKCYLTIHDVIDS